MQISIRPVRLDGHQGDCDAVLIFRGDRLVAVASRLSDLHGGLCGSFFIEAIFGPRDHHVGSTFRGEEELRRWAEGLGEERPQLNATPIARGG